MTVVTHLNTQEVVAYVNNDGRLVPYDTAYDSGQVEDIRTRLVEKIGQPGEIWDAAEFGHLPRDERVTFRGF